MVRSMTGYGRSELVSEGRRFSVEMKSVNNRYLDLNIRLPRLFNPLEAKLRNLLKDYIERGKVDIYINFEDSSDHSHAVMWNKGITDEYVGYMREMAETYSIPLELSTAVLASLPDVFAMHEESQDAEALWEPLKECAIGAAEQFTQARAREGSFLKTDILGKLDSMQQAAAFLTERAPAIVSAYQKELREKVAELLEGGTVDENRIIQEIAIYSDKICIDEELVRLSSHIEAMRQELEKSGSIGRKLDFLAQEMNREANTILSKTTDAEASVVAVDLKTTVEKVREQIQNIE